MQKLFRKKLQKKSKLDNNILKKSYIINKKNICDYIFLGSKKTYNINVFKIVTIYKVNL